MPWICRLLIPTKTAREIAVPFYQILPGYSSVLTGYLPRFEVSRDVNMVQTQRFESMSKKCFFWLFT